MISRVKLLHLKSEGSGHSFITKSPAGPINGTYSSHDPS